MSISAYSPGPQMGKRELREFYLLQVLRALLACSVLFIFAPLIDFGTSLWLLVVGVWLGIFAAGALALRGLSAPKTVLFHLAAYALFWVLLSAADAVLGVGLPKEPSLDFLVYRFSLHIHLILAFYVAAMVLTWLFWRYYHTLTAEIFAASVILVWLLSGHRNFNPDAPKQLSQIAWDYHLSTYYVIIAIAVMFTLLAAAYLFFASSRPLMHPTTPQKHREKSSLPILLGSTLIAILLLGAYAYHIGKTLGSDLSRIAEGVGEASMEGTSPLGFHSAVGKTKQPAALVRLEADYPQNPWSPMLYLREGALSQYNGRELVIASPAFDSDVPRGRPGMNYTASTSALPGERDKIAQSYYLLVEHRSLFGLDTPTNSRPLRNPDPDRFELAYQVVSQAPTAKVVDLLDHEVGSPEWDKDTWAHYLRAPASLAKPDKPFDLSSLSLQQPILDDRGEDFRYGLMAAQLFGDIEQPVARAAAIAQYLSETSIYTRSPGHQTTAQGDPIAPYLFAQEKRGYCSHFAHAAVYMMRLLGIPARIATGYLTDLTYARDGHILLHLGDRHAWPEIYVRDKGWVVVDVTPTQAENEQALIPDEKLLEDLMSRIDPAEKLPDEELNEPQASGDADSQPLNFIFNKRLVMLLGALLLALFLAVKLWLWYGFRAFCGEQRLRLAYNAFLARMADLGRWRRIGETRKEFSERLLRETSIDAQDLTALNELRTYGSGAERPEGAKIESAVSSFEDSYSSAYRRALRIISFLNPVSLFRMFRW